MALPLTKIEKHLKEYTDPDDLVAVEVVDRYIELIRTYRQMQRIIKKDGIRVITINGHQEFIKAHPLITEMRKIDSQLINLKRDIDKHIEDYAEKQKRDAADYQADDLM